MASLVRFQPLAAASALRPVLEAVGEENGLELRVVDERGLVLVGPQTAPQTGTPDSEASATATALRMTAAPRLFVEARDPTAGALARAQRRRYALTLAALGLAVVVVACAAAYAVRGLRREAEANRRQADFVANVTHQLRTPLTAILIHAELLASQLGEDPRGARESAGFLLGEGTRLLHLVENVLSLARTEGERRSYPRSLQDVAPLVRETAEAMRGLLGRQGIELEIDVPPELPPAPVHREAVRQALLNLLDNALPKLDGFEVLRRVRAAGCSVPVICLTARGQEIDRVVGLELGADDYVVKPFFLRELEARVKAVLRRFAAARVLVPEEPEVAAAGPSGDHPQTLSFGPVRIDLKAGCLYRRGRRVELAPKELSMLRLFAARPGEAISRATFLREVWGLECFPTTRTVDTHVSRLRKKIEENPKTPRHIVSVPRVGYRYDP